MSENRCKMKANKTVSLPIDVAQRLSEEENQSETVEKALRVYYGMEGNGNEKSGAGASVGASVDTKDN